MTAAGQPRLLPKRGFTQSETTDATASLYRRERRRDTYSLVDGSEGLEREGGHYDVGLRTDYKAKIRCQLDRKKGTDSKMIQTYTEVLWNDP